MFKSSDNPPRIESGEAMAEAGRYARLAEANERALVILSMGHGYWLFKDGAQFVLCVESRHKAAVARELDKFEMENRSPWPSARAEFLIPPLSLFVFSWVMTLFFLLQQRDPDWWVERGGASTGAILRQGQWWRIMTALTLHANFSHFAANLITGLLFAAFLLPVLGTGVTWTGILMSGALGNLLDAWLYREQPRVSIGASTAVFGSLGILVACRTMDTLSSPRKIRLWELILPLGAGLALLAFLGTGGEQTDYMAHFWGFVSGCGLGACAAWWKLKERTPATVQRLLAFLAPACLVAAWLRAAAP